MEKSIAILGTINDAKIDVSREKQALDSINMIGQLLAIEETNTKVITLKNQLKLYCLAIDVASAAPSCLKKLISCPSSLFDPNIGSAVNNITPLRYAVMSQKIEAVYSGAVNLDQKK